MTAVQVSSESDASEPPPPWPIRAFAFFAPILALVNGFFISTMDWPIAEMPRVGRATLIMVAIAYVLGLALRDGSARAWFITIVLSGIALAAYFFLWLLINSVGASRGQEVTPFRFLRTSLYGPGAAVAILALWTLFWPASIRYVFNKPKPVKGPPDPYPRFWTER